MLKGLSRFVSELQAFLIPFLLVVIVLSGCSLFIWLVAGPTPQWYVDKQKDKCEAYRGRFVVARRGDGVIIHVSCKDPRREAWLDYAEWEKGK